MNELGPRNTMEQQTTIDIIKYYAEGAGVVSPTGLVSDQEIFEVVHDNQKPVTDAAKVCIDGRPELEAQPVRQKMAGGNLATGFVAAELSGWSLYTDAQLQSTVAERLASVANHLVEAGEVLGGHIDNHATEEKSNCGAADGLPKHLSVIASNGKDAEFIAQMRDALGDSYSEEIWTSIVDRAQATVMTDAYADWNGQRLITAIKERNGIVETLTGDNLKPDLDPQDIRHNHWEEAVVLNTVPGISNDRDTSRLQHFQVDAPALIETCQRMASSTTEFATLLHAAVGYQFAVRYSLTSNQRNMYI